MNNLTIGLGGICLVLFGLLLKANQKLGEEREACNARQLAAVAQAENEVRIAQQRAFEQRIAQLERNASLADQARAIAEAARIEAEQRPERVREVIRRVADLDACIDSPIDPDILERLRSGTNSHEN